MALIPCPDCGRQISDAAPMCIGCGRPMTPVSAAAAAGADAAALARIARLAPSAAEACPRCGGELVPFTRIHEDIQQTGNATTDPLARRVAPPDRAQADAGEGCGWVFLGALIVAAITWLVGSFPWAIAAFVVSSFAFARASHVRRKPLVDERHRAALERWQQLRLCARCGVTVMRADNGALVVEELDAEVDALLRQGQMIQAIKLVRERRGLGLKEAKDWVDARQAGLDRS